MRLSGERITRTRFVHTEKYVVAVQVEMVVPVDDASEPCYEAEAVQFLRAVEEHARKGDVAWLRQRGRVYRAIDAA
ncbi:MAG: hypothetical protein AB1486_29625 [Planctomycetota bacterium]